MAAIYHNKQDGSVAVLNTRLEDMRVHWVPETQRLYITVGKYDVLLEASEVEVVVRASHGHAGNFHVLDADCRVITRHLTVVAARAAAIAYAKASPRRTSSVHLFAEK